MDKLKPAVFLDRDGTINEQLGYINHISRFVLLPGVGAAIAKLNAAGVTVVVVSNQSGVARGYFPEELVYEVHLKMESLLDMDHAKLDGVYFCPHHPDAELEEYRQACDCRKPAMGLIKQAADELGIDLSRSYIVGDRVSDIKTGRKAKLGSVLVLTGYGRGDLEYILPHSDVEPDFIAENLTQSVDWILKDLSNKKG